MKISTRSLMTAFIMIVVLVAVVAPAGLAQADTLNVPSGLYPTIQSAVDAANPAGGDIIVVAAGTYNENVSINKTLTLEAASGAQPIINGSITIQAGTNGVTINGFRINDGSLIGGDRIGIYITGGTSGHTISNNVLDGPGTAIASRGILYGGGTSGIMVRNNEITDWVSGIYINPSSSLTIQANNIHDNFVGIGSDGLNNVTIQYNTITNNTEGFGASNVGDGVAAHNNNFSGNTEALHNYSGSAINATSNWWGHESGPTHPGNPDGQGDPVSDGMDYQNWLLEPYSAGGSGEYTGCFIATAAYGDPDNDSSVQTLRDFRDNRLTTDSVGSVFVSTYYSLSPPIARFIDDHAGLKPVSRTGLAPAVAVSSVAINTTPIQKLLMMASLLIVLGVMSVYIRSRRVEGAHRP